MDVATRAYSVLDIKSVNEESRTIRGIATTPSTDRMGDVVEPLGVKFSNPMPLLWQHKSDKPVGLATFEKPTKAGIEFEASLAKVSEPGALKDRIDEAWQSVKHGLVRGVSIGFRPIEYAFMDKGSGIRFSETEVMELSLVTIPANQDATINLIKSIDTGVRAANGNAQSGDEPSPGATGKPKPVPRAKPMSKTIAEQISAFEATRQAKSARINEIQDGASEENRTKDESEREEFQNIQRELESIDQELVDLRLMEKMNIAAARPVENVKDPDSASQARSGVAAVVKAPKVPPGIPFTRFVMALTVAKGNLMLAEQIASNNERWKAETPEVGIVLRAAVAAGTTTDPTWAGPLVQYQNLASEFVEFLRPMTIIGRIQGLRRVPFKIKIPRMTGGASVQWVGEGRVKPISALAFDSITLDISKIAGIIVLTDELVRLSSPAAEGLVRDELAAAIVQYMDAQFVDPTKAASDVSPASITNGVTPVTASGTTATALRTDVTALMAQFLSANMQLSSANWIMTQRTALSIQMMMNALGQNEFAGISMNGGSFFGIPLVTSEGVPPTGGSPANGYPIILVNASDILLADDGQVMIDASREASLQMDNAPDSPPTGSTNLLSLWQHNMMAIKAERYINWAKRRAGAVAYISGAKYTG
jgi:HK97 family phage major capsid protein/HK97 family phage prohead protease